MKSLMAFLFGKSPDIFDENGEVRHKFPEEKWKAWDQRFHKAAFNWRKHTALSRQKSRNAKP